MGKKHVNADKGAQFQSSKGRRPSESSTKPKDNSSGRERNVSHSKSEEHSRVSKGNK